MQTIDSIKIRDAMSLVEFTVSPCDKIDEVAKLFQQHHVNSAPVVDEFDRCIGIITSEDLVRFQSELTEVNSGINQGLSFEVTQQQTDGSLKIVSHPFDEVQRQMTATLQTIDQSQSLRLAAKMMCEQHVHHLIVLDDAQRPYGILSSLDILAKLDR